MEGRPRQVIDRYQQLTFPNKDAERWMESEETKAAECTSVTFCAPNGEESIRTGYPMRARVGYRASTPVKDAEVRVSIFWPSGYLCAQLSTGLTELAVGSGAVEFRCPVLPVVPGLYRIDVGIEVNGKEIDARQRCATLRVDPGKPVFGDFHIENEWSVLADQPLVPDFQLPASA
jgi:hypothetical protein